MSIHYTFLRESQRRDEKTLAEDLLRTTKPEIGFDPVQFCKGMSINDALNSPFIKPSNVLAALVSGNKDCWWYEIVFNKSDDTFSWQPNEDCPAKSRDQAERSLRTLMGNLQLMQEHPIVAECRKRGLAPESVWCLEVTRRDGRCKVVYRAKAQVKLEEAAFVQRFEPTDLDDDDWIISVYDEAREIISNNWDQLIPFLDEDQCNSALCEAISFFTARGGVCSNCQVSRIWLDW